jgi:hypothetical protein
MLASNYRMERQGMVPGNKNKKVRSSPLDVAKVMEDFQKSEEASPRRNGTFKINKPFDEALGSILKAKPEPRGSKKHRS